MISSFTQTFIRKYDSFFLLPSNQRLSKGVSGRYLMTHILPRSIATVEGLFWGLSQPTLSTFPVGVTKVHRENPRLSVER